MAGGMAGLCRGASPTPLLPQSGGARWHSAKAPSGRLPKRGSQKPQGAAATQLRAPKSPPPIHQRPLLRGPRSERAAARAGVAVPGDCQPASARVRSAAVRESTPRVSLSDWRRQLASSPHSRRTAPSRPATSDGGNRKPAASLSGGPSPAWLDGCSKQSPSPAAPSRSVPPLPPYPQLPRANFSRTWPVPALPGEGVDGLRDEPAAASQELCPEFRLEVMLRGVFVDRERATDQGDDDEEALTGEEARATSGEVPLQLPGLSLGVTSQTDDALREVAAQRARMGFGRLEGGATPSGRTSVPAVRGGSAPPPTLSADVGIELEALCELLGRHFRRVLARSFGASSRAASSEGVEGDGVCTEPSRPASCPSPSPDGYPVLSGMCEQQPRCSIELRLCRSRCGSSCAVIELKLGHPDWCRTCAGCQCSPPPEAAAVQLMAHFARHSLLRLSTTRPPVRVLIEPLESCE